MVKQRSRVTYIMVCRLISALAALTAMLAPSVCTFADTVYFTNKTTGSLLSFEWTTTTSGTVGGGARLTGLNSPNGMGLGPDGNLYITETGSNRAGKITRVQPVTGTSSLMPNIVVDMPGTTPAGVAFLPGGGNMIVSSLDPADDEDGTVLFQVTDWSGNSASVSPYSAFALNGGAGVSTGPLGTVFVSNNPGYNGSVLAFTSGSANPTTVIANGSGPSQTAAPTGVLVAGSSLYSLSITDYRVLKTDLSVMTPTSITLSTLPAFSFPSALAMLSNGSLLVGTAAGTGQFFVVDPSTGNYSDFVVAGGGQVGGIAVVPEPAGLVVAVTGLVTICCVSWRRRSARN
jgi:hypothetical protein